MLHRSDVRTCVVINTFLVFHSLFGIETLPHSRTRAESSQIRPLGTDGGTAGAFIIFNALSAGDFSNQLQVVLPFLFFF